MMPSTNNHEKLVIYVREDNRIRVHHERIDGNIWLTTQEIARLFNISEQDCIASMEAVLSEVGTKELASLTMSQAPVLEGERDHTQLYNLEMILAVGYRVSSPRGAQFRRWATEVLKDYLVKGFAMDDERLKDPAGQDYFDELLERIRDIRASEKRFYQKVKDIFTTAVDYDPKSSEAQLFFKKVQNKMLWAVTGRTAAELIAGRSDPAAANMGLTSWKGSIVRRGDVTTAKNYLKAEELDELNRIVVMYLDYAELQAKNRKTTTMTEWAEKLDAFLTFNDREVLTNAGKMRADVADRLALERFEAFDAARRERDAIEADAADIAEIERIVKGQEKI